MKLTMMMAMTADGFIAKSDRHYPDWTGKADKQLFVRITRAAGVVIMGSKTFDLIGKPLPGRKNIVITRNPSRVSQWENLLYTQGPPERLLKALEAEGFKEAILAGGAVINTLFAKKGLIDEMCLTVCPVIFGSGIALFSEPVEMDLEVLEQRPLPEHAIFLRYRVKK